MRPIGLETGRSLVRPRHVVELLTALAMALVPGMLALGGVLLLDSRAGAWHRAGKASDILVPAFTRDALYDQSQGGAAGLARPGIDRISAVTRQMTLFDRAANSELRGSPIVANLRSIAKCIALNVLCPSDTNPRYGGEEFAVLLSETDLTGAAVLAERIRPPSPHRRFPMKARTNERSILYNILNMQWLLVENSNESSEL